MEFGKSCCFTGHRPAKLPWKYDERDPRCIEFKDRLSSVIGAVYDSGISHFIALKEQHDDVTLEAAIPYIGQADNWGYNNKRRYEHILSHCDKKTVIQEQYSPSCMMRRNRYMVDNSSVLIACYDGKSGGTWNTIRYAMERDVELIQLPTE